MNMASGRAFHALHPSFGSRLARGCMYVFLILFALSIVYPFWVTLITSFSTVDEVTTLGFKLWIDLHMVVDPQPMLRQVQMVCRFDRPQVVLATMVLAYDQLDSTNTLDN